MNANLKSKIKFYEWKFDVLLFFHTVSNMKDL